jgi:aldehyde:ferredoxin oxidoreductase
VMGSKKLKAIVVRGKGNIKIAKPDVLERFVNDRKNAGDWRINSTQSWGRTSLNGGAIAAEMTKYYKKPGGCFGCPYQCQGFYNMPNIGKGVQMCVDAWYGWFSNGSAPGYWEGNILSQKLGINNYQLLSLMSFLITGIRLGSFNKSAVGLTTIPVLEGLSSETAHHAFLTELLGGIAKGTSIFSQGLARAAKQIGDNAWTAYELCCAARGYSNHHFESIVAALLWSLDVRDPMDSGHDSFFTFGRVPSIASYFGIPSSGYLNASGIGIKNVYDQSEIETSWLQIHQSLKNSLPICEYASIPSNFYHPPSMDVQQFEAQLLSAITGIDYSVEALWQTGERIFNLRRAIMVLRENRTRTEDTLNHFWFEQKIGGTEGLSAPIDTTQFEALKTRYYQLRGWNTDNGWPTAAKLQELGMKDVADKLATANKLG